jgi:FtsH-binding integral membrane protein
MIRSRVLTFGFRYLFGLAVFALFASFAYALSDNAANTDQGLVESITGPLTAGWKGGVGNHLAYGLLLSTAVVTGFLAFLTIAFRDADPRAQAEVVGVESLPLTRAPVGAGYAPVVGAIAAGLVVVGLVASREVAIVGLVALLCVAFVWTVRSWANRATGDDATNLELYHRIIDPLQIPVLGLVVVGFVVFGLSRALLATSKAGSVLVFAAAALVFFAIAALLATRPRRFDRSILGVVLIIGAAGLLVAAVIGLLVGQRDFEEHGALDGGAGAAAVVQLVPGDVVVEEIHA